MQKKKELAITPLLTAIGLAISAFTAFWLYEMEKKSLIISFQREVDLRATSLHRELTVNFEALQDLGIFFGEGFLPDHDKFRALAREILKHLPHIQALEWIPRVTSDNKEKMLQTIRKHYPGFEITQYQQGAMVPAPPKDEHFPVYFVEPYKGHEMALGFDLSTNQARREILETARDTGLPQASASITLIQDKSTQKAFLAVMPVYKGAHNTLAARRKNLAGFVLGIYKTNDLFRQSRVSGQISDIHMVMVDKTDQNNDRLSENFSEIEHDHLEHHEQPFYYEKDLPPLLGRQWSVTSHPSQHYISSNISPLPFVVLLFGIVFTTMITLYAGLLIKRNSVIHRTVKEQTRDLIQAQEASKDFQNKMIEMNKMASLGAMSAGIGHELSQPLGTILLKCQMLPKALNQRDYEKSLKFVGDIRDQAVRAKEIMDSLRIISRDARPEDKTSIELNRVIRKAEVLIKEDLTMNRIELKKELSPDIYIYASPVQLGQVVANLLTNARDALEDAEEKVITLRSYIKEGNGIIEIEDTGSGIPEEYQSKIFEPFFTSKAIGKGTGLGLSMCYSMVLENEGDISFRTAANKGTCFIVSIPLTRS
ncbi:CHASE domain-containing protein [Endozoicomonas lisbonensis]